MATAMAHATIVGHKSAGDGTHSVRRIFGQCPITSPHAPVTDIRCPAFYTASTAGSYETGVCDEDKKAHGQTLQSVGVYLDSFMNGQLYMS